MRTFAQKPKTTQQTKTAKSTNSGRSLSVQSRDVHPIFNLQRTIGNHAVQRLLQANPGSLEVAPAQHSFSHSLSRTFVGSGLVQRKADELATGGSVKARPGGGWSAGLTASTPTSKKKGQCSLSACQRLKNRHGHPFSSWVILHNGGIRVVNPYIHLHTKGSHPSSVSFLDRRTPAGKLPAMVELSPCPMVIGAPSTCKFKLVYPGSKIPYPQPRRTWVYLRKLKKMPGVVPFHVKLAYTGGTFTKTICVCR